MGAAPTRRGTLFEARLVVLAFWEPVFPSSDENARVIALAFAFARAISLSIKAFIIRRRRISESCSSTVVGIGPPFSLRATETDRGDDSPSEWSDRLRRWPSHQIARVARLEAWRGRVRWALGA